jgi:hypothetical protein
MHLPGQRLSLSIKAELENVTDLVPASDAFEYSFQVRLIRYRFDRSISQIWR